MPRRSGCAHGTHVLGSAGRVSAGRRGNQGFPAEASVPASECPTFIWPGINHCLESELLIQKLLLSGMDVLAAGLVPSVSCWINSNNVGQCVPSSKTPTQEDVVSCQFHPRQKHDELPRLLRPSLPYSE